MRIDKINDHVKGVDLVEFNQQKAALNLCGVYSKARPVLEFVSKFPLPKKWKVIIKGLIAVLDGLCPQS